MSVGHNNRDLGSAIVDRNSMIFAGKLKIPKNSILRPKKVPKTSRYKGGWQKIFFYYFSLCNFTPFQKFVGKTSKLGACCMRKTLIQGRFCTVPLRGNLRIFRNKIKLHLLIHNVQIFRPILESITLKSFDIFQKISNFLEFQGEIWGFLEIK